MADYSVNTRFDPVKSFKRVKYGYNAKLLETELNESQQIKEWELAELIRNLTYSGFLDFITPAVDAVATSTMLAGQIGYYPSSEGYAIAVGKAEVLVNGYLAQLYGTATDGRTLVRLATPPTSAARDDLVFAEFWFQEITKDSTIKKYGGYDNTVIANDLFDTRPNAETARRIQLCWRFRHSESINFTTYPLGINAPTVHPMGGNDVEDTAYIFTAAPTDSMLFVAGDGTSSAKLAFGSVDGYIYAIPIAKVNRQAGNSYVRAVDITDLRYQVNRLLDKITASGNLQKVNNDIQVKAEQFAPWGYGLGSYTQTKAAVDLNNITAGGGYYIATNCTNKPVVTGGHLLVVATDANNVVQQYTPYDTNATYQRLRTSGVWGSWQRVVTKDYSDTLYAPTGYGLGKGVAAAPSDLNNLIAGGFYVTSSTAANRPTLDGVYYHVICMGDSPGGSNITQIAKPLNDNTKMYWRSKINGTWQAWKQIPSWDMCAPAGYGLGTSCKDITSTSLNDLNGTGFYQGSDLGMAPASGFWYVIHLLNLAGYKQQIAFTSGSGNVEQKMYIRNCVNGTWTPWKQVPTKDLTDTWYAPAGYGPGMTALTQLSGDLNAVKTTGMYFVPQAACTNKPVAINGSLVVEASSATYTKQTFSAVDGSGIYARYRVDSTWSAWKRIGQQYIVGTGSVSDGGTIPLPSGCTSHAGIIVSSNTSPSTQFRYDVDEGGPYVGNQIICDVNQSTRVVTCRWYYANDGAEGWHVSSGVANYLILGVS